MSYNILRFSYSSPSYPSFPFSFSLFLSLPNIVSLQLVKIFVCVELSNQLLVNLLSSLSFILTSLTSRLSIRAIPFSIPSSLSFSHRSFHLESRDPYETSKATNIFPYPFIYPVCAHAVFGLARVPLAIGLRSVPEVILPDLPMFRKPTGLVATTECTVVQKETCIFPQ